MQSENTGRQLARAFCSIIVPRTRGSLQVHLLVWDRPGLFLECWLMNAHAARGDDTDQHKRPPKAVLHTEQAICVAAACCSPDGYTDAQLASVGPFILVNATVRGDEHRSTILLYRCFARHGPCHLHRRLTPPARNATVTAVTLFPIADSRHMICAGTSCGECYIYDQCLESHGGTWTDTGVEDARGGWVSILGCTQQTGNSPDNAAAISALCCTPLDRDSSPTAIRVILVVSHTDGTVGSKLFTITLGARRSICGLGHKETRIHAAFGHIHKIETVEKQSGEQIPFILSGTMRCGILTVTLPEHGDAVHLCPIGTAPCPKKPIALERLDATGVSVGARGRAVAVTRPKGRIWIAEARTGVVASTLKFSTGDPLRFDGLGEVDDGLVIAWDIAQCPKIYLLHLDTVTAVPIQGLRVSGRPLAVTWNTDLGHVYLLVPGTTQTDNNGLELQLVQVGIVTNPLVAALHLLQRVACMTALGNVEGQGELLDALTTIFGTAWFRTSATDSRRSNGHLVTALLQRWTVHLAERLTLECEARTSLQKSLEFVTQQDAAPMGPMSQPFPKAVSLQSPHTRRRFWDEELHRYTLRRRRVLTARRRTSLCMDALQSPQKIAESKKTAADFRPRHQALFCQKQKETTAAEAKQEESVDDEDESVGLPHKGGRLTMVSFKYDNSLRQHPSDSPPSPWDFRTLSQCDLRSCGPSTVVTTWSIPASTFITCPVPTVPSSPFPVSTSTPAAPPKSQMQNDTRPSPRRNSLTLQDASFPVACAVVERFRYQHPGTSPLAACILLDWPEGIIRLSASRPLDFLASRGGRCLIVSSLRRLRRRAQTRLEGRRLAQRSNVAGKSYYGGGIWCPKWDLPYAIAWCLVSHRLLTLNWLLEFICRTAEAKRVVRKAFSVMNAARPKNAGALASTVMSLLSLVRGTWRVLALHFNILFLTAYRIALRGVGHFHPGLFERDVIRTCATTLLLGTSQFELRSVRAAGT